MRRVLLTAAVLALSACSSPEAEPAAAAPAAASAVDPAAEAFVRSLYTVEQGGASTGAEDEAARPMFSARTSRLLAENEAVTPEGEVGYENIHICDCSDDGGMVLNSVTVTPRGADRADATVSMTWTAAQPPETKRQTLNLIRENGRWVIDDIQRDQSANLVAGLTDYIAETRAASQ